MEGPIFTKIYVNANIENFIVTLKYKQGFDFNNLFHSFLSPVLSS